MVSNVCTLSARGLGNGEVDRSIGSGLSEKVYSGQRRGFLKQPLVMCYLRFTDTYLRSWVGLWCLSVCLSRLAR